MLTDTSRILHAATGNKLTAKGWGQEAALRMLHNNLDPAVAEHPENLVVYGGTGKAARNWQSFDAIVKTLTNLKNDETMLVQSGKPVGVFQTNEWAPRVLLANSNLVGDWANWPEFRRLEQLGLTMYGQVYVGDGFGAVHRKHASVYELAMMMPHAAGDLIVTELGVLEKLTTNPNRPYGVVLGGAKVSDKMGVISNLLEKVDLIAIGGGMVFTFLSAQGKEIGKSLVESDLIPTVKELIKRAENLGVKIILPTDIVVAKEFNAESKASIVASDEIPKDQMGLDIGPESSRFFADEIGKCRTVFWNGPMGVFEFNNFSNGTRSVAQALTKIDGTSVVGGGDSAAAVRKLGFNDQDFGYISTGGGASLEYLEGKELPGLVALS